MNKNLYKLEFFYSVWIWGKCRHPTTASTGLTSKSCRAAPTSGWTMTQPGWPSRTSKKQTRDTTDAESTSRNRPLETPGSTWLLYVSTSSIFSLHGRVMCFIIDTKTPSNWPPCAADLFCPQRSAVAFQWWNKNTFFRLESARPFAAHAQFYDLPALSLWEYWP